MKTKIMIIGALVGIFAGTSDVQAAKFYFSANDTLIQNCPTNVQLKVNTEGTSVLAGDATVLYNASQASITSVAVGSALPMKVFEAINSDNIKLSASRLPLTGAFSGDGTYGTISLTPALGTSQLQLYFSDDLENDNRLADTNIQNVLTSAESVSFQVLPRYDIQVDGIGFCGPDTAAPSVQMTSPFPNSPNNTLNPDITLVFTDNRLGVDLSSISITVNGVTFTPGSPNASVTGTPSAYTITLAQAGPFESGQNIAVSVNACDLKSPANCRNYTTGFTTITPEVVQECAMTEAAEVAPEEVTLEETVAETEVAAECPLTTVTTSSTDYVGETYIPVCVLRDGKKEMIRMAAREWDKYANQAIAFGQCPKEPENETTPEPEEKNEITEAKEEITEEQPIAEEAKEETPKPLTPTMLQAALPNKFAKKITAQTCNNPDITKVIEILQPENNIVSSDLNPVISGNVTKDVTKVVIWKSPVNDELGGLREKIGETSVFKTYPTVEKCETISAFKHFEIKNEKPFEDGVQFLIEAEAYMEGAEGETSILAAAYVTFDSKKFGTPPQNLRLSNKQVPPESMTTSEKIAKSFLKSFKFFETAKAENGSALPLTINDTTPDLSGKTQPGAEVVAIWNTGQIVYDAQKTDERGRFELQAPLTLEPNEIHRVSVFARLETADGAKYRSPAVTVYFQVKEKTIAEKAIVAALIATAVSGAAYVTLSQQGLSWVIRLIKR